MTSGPSGSQLLLCDVDAAGSRPQFAAPWGWDGRRGRAERIEMGGGALSLDGCGVCAFFWGESSPSPSLFQPVLVFLSYSRELSLETSRNLSVPSAVYGELAEGQDICTLTLPWGVCLAIRTPGCWQTHYLLPPHSPVSKEPC